MWKMITSKVVFRHPTLVAIEDIVELPSGERLTYLKFEASHDAATIVCIRGDEVLLQREYSYPPNEMMYHFPGGKVNATEPVLDGANRELAEEAGLKAGNMTELGWFYINNRRSSAKMYIYLATDSVEIERPVGDIGEEIIPEWMPITRVNKLIKAGKIHNGPLLGAWAMYTAHVAATAKPKRKR